MKFKRIVEISLVAATAATAVAHAADAPPPNGWSGAGQLGYVMSRGNTDSDSANGKFALNYIQDDWKHALTAEALYGRSGEITSAQRWAATFQSNYTINPRTYLFGALHYENDRFSGFQYQGSGAAGVGYKVLDTDTNKLAVQVGAGYRKLRPELLVLDASGAVIDRIPQDSEGNVIGTAGLDYAHVFNASTQLTDKFAMETGSNNTSLQNDLALQVKMSKALALSVGYSIRDNTKPPAGLKKIDTLTTVNLVYAFGQT